MSQVQQFYLVFLFPVFGDRRYQDVFMDGKMCLDL